MQITPRALLLLLLTAPLLAASAWWGPALLLAAGWLIVLLALLIADWQLSPSPRQWSLERSHDNRLSLAAANRIAIRVLLRQGRKPVRVWVRDTPPPNFAVAADRVLAGEAAPGQPAIFTYDVTPPRRGDYQFGECFTAFNAGNSTLIVLPMPVGAWQSSCPPSVQILYTAPIMARWPGR